MNNTEKLVLKSIIKNFESVIQAPWNKDLGGDFEAWTAFAKNMKTTIISNNTILSDLAEEDSDEEKDKDPLNY